MHLSSYLNNFKDIDIPNEKIIGDPLFFKVKEMMNRQSIGNKAIFLGLVQATRFENYHLVHQILDHPKLNISVIPKGAYNLVKNLIKEHNYPKMLKILLVHPKINSELFSQNGKLLNKMIHWESADYFFEVYKLPLFKEIFRSSLTPEQLLIEKEYFRIVTLSKNKEDERSNSRKKNFSFSEVNEDLKMVGYFLKKESFPPFLLFYAFKVASFWGNFHLMNSLLENETPSKYSIKQIFKNAIQNKNNHILELLLKNKKFNHEIYLNKAFKIAAQSYNLEAIQMLFFNERLTKKKIWDKKIIVLMKGISNDFLLKNGNADINSVIHRPKSDIITHFSLPLIKKLLSFEKKGLSKKLNQKDSVFFHSLKKAFKNGNDEIFYIFKKHLNTVVESKLLKWCIKKGMDKLYLFSPLNKDNFKKALNYSIRFKQSSLLKKILAWHYERFKSIIINVIGNHLYQSNKSMLQYLVASLQKKEFNEYAKFIKFTMEKNDSQSLLILLKHSHLNLRIEKKSIFKWGCQNGHLEIVKYLYEQNILNNLSLNEYLNDAILYNHSQIVKFLLAIHKKPFDKKEVSLFIDNAFILKNKNIISQILIDKNIYPSIQAEDLFRISMFLRRNENFHLETIDLIVNHPNIKLNKIEKTVFIWLCQNRNININNFFGVI